MADEQDIAFKVSIPGGGQSLKDLKKEFNDIQKELSGLKVGTAEYQKALERLGAVKDDIGDLKDTINALNPEGKVAAFAKVGSTIASGFAAAQGAAALFGNESEDLQKTIMKVQAAMALTEGIKGITAAGDAFKVLNVVMRANPIMAIVTGFTALATAVALLYKNYQDATSASAKLEKQHEELKVSTNALTKSIDIQIKSLSGLKANEDEILKLGEKKLKLNIELAKSNLQVALAKQFEAEQEFDYMEQSLRFAGKKEEADKLQLMRTKEQRDATKLAIEGLRESIAGLAEFHNIQEQKKLDVSAAANKQFQQDAKERKAIRDKEAQELDEWFNKQIEGQLAQEERLKKDEEERKEKFTKDSEALDDYFNTSLQKGSDARTEEVKQIEDAEAKKRAAKQKTNDDTLAGTAQAVQKTQQIFALYFEWQLKQNKGNAAAERDIRKKQFAVNKAFGIAGSIIDGIGAVQKALNNPYPLNIILAVLTGVLATANTIKIATAKFDDGGGASADTGGMNVTAAAPVVPQPNNTTTTISDEGKVTPKDTGPQKVFVLEDDIRKSNRRITNIEETAKI